MKEPPKSKQELQESFRSICRENGWKCTMQRLSVYECIHSNHDHPGIDEIWNKVKKTIPSVTRESVFRILEEFSQKNLISRLDNLSSARYDSVTTPHCHLICRRCGAIIDYELEGALPLPSGVDSSTLSHIELRLSGLCPKCKKANKGDN